MIALALPFVAMLGVAAVCRAIGLSRATWYRLQTPAVAGPSRPPEAPARRSPRRLSEAEERRVLDALHEPRFADQAPAEVYASLLR